MKSTINRGESFAPVKLELVFETENEVYNFLGLCRTNDSAPKVAYENWGKQLLMDRGELRSMLIQMKDNIESQGFDSRDRRDKR